MEVAHPAFVKAERGLFYFCPLSFIAPFPSRQVRDKRDVTRVSASDNVIHGERRLLKDANKTRFVSGKKRRILR